MRAKFLKPYLSYGRMPPLGIPVATTDTNRRQVPTAAERRVSAHFCPTPDGLMHSVASHTVPWRCSASNIPTLSGPQTTASPLRINDWATSFAAAALVREAAGPVRSRSG